MSVEAIQDGKNNQETFLFFVYSPTEFYSPVIAL